jgi:hypothetical protein
MHPVRKQLETQPFAGRTVTGQPNPSTDSVFRNLSSAPKTFQDCRMLIGLFGFYRENFFILDPPESPGADSQPIISKCLLPS